MGYATLSDPLLRVAVFSGLAVFLLIIVLLAAIAILRYTVDRRRRMEQLLSERWQPVFFHAVEGIPFAVPRVYGRDREMILLIWIHFTESIRGDARLRLCQLALDLKLDRTALKLLLRRNVRHRLMAIVALGRMRSSAVWDQLVELVASPNPMLSLLAARSLLQIDASRASPIVVGELIRRDDWQLVKVRTMISEAPPNAIASHLMEALASATPENIPRLLSLTLNVGDAWAVVESMLSTESSSELLIAALKACNDSRALEPVRQLALHTDWIVRAQAAMALGRIGVEEDGLRLRAMLSDPEWWVRYRAGISLVQMPFASRKKLEQMCNQLSDRFAADILRQVLAETADGMES